MQKLQNAVIAIMLSGLSGTVFAEVYETRDAQGNPVFSDAASSDAVRIDVPPSNVADAVEVEDHPQSVTAAPAAHSQESPSSGGSVVYEGEQRHEVGDGDLQRHEVGDEDLHRHEVGDDTVEHSHDDGDDDHQHAVQGFDGTGMVGQRHIRGRHRHHR
jgi:hypothetical protein